MGGGGGGGGRFAKISHFRKMVASAKLVFSIDGFILRFCCEYLEFFGMVKNNDAQNKTYHSN